MLLEQCRIGYLAKDLYVEADWSHVLSGGEQQRLAFVRALIYQPSWLFLDKATLPSMFPMVNKVFAE